MQNVFTHSHASSHGILLALGLFWAGACFGQSETTLGDSNAQRCFRESQLLDSSRDAIATCTMAIKDRRLSDRDLAATYSNRGILYTRNKEYDKALADHDRAIQLMPTMGEAYINRGNVYFHNKDYDKALADYEKAIQLKARPQGTGWYNKGLTLIKLKRYDEARTALEEALKLDPGSRQIKQSLAELGAPATPTR